MAEKFGIKEVMDVTFYNVETGEPVLFVDSLKMSTLENTAEEVEARGGRGNPVLITWDYNREAEFTIQDALISFEGLSLLTGVANEKKDDIVLYKRETLPVTATAAELSETPVDPETGEPDDDYVFVYDAATGIAGGTVSGASVSGKNVTDLGAIDNILVYYPYKHDQSGEDQKIDVVEVSSADFPGTYRIVGDTIVRNVDGVDEPFQLVVERAKVRPGFSLTMEAEGDPSVFDMNLRVMKPAATTKMVQMIKYKELTS